MIKLRGTGVLTENEISTEISLQGGIRMHIDGLKTNVRGNSKNMLTG